MYRPRGSLPYSQEEAAVTCQEPNESYPHLYTVSLSLELSASITTVPRHYLRLSEMLFFQAYIETSNVGKIPSKCFLIM
jgi:hypothetical protein